MDSSSTIATETLSRRLSLPQVWAAMAVLVPVLVVTATPLVAIDLA